MSRWSPPSILMSQSGTWPFRRSTSRVRLTKHPVSTDSAVETSSLARSSRAFSKFFSALVAMHFSVVKPPNTAVDVALRAGPSATGVASAHHLSVRGFRLRFLRRSPRNTSAAFAWVCNVTQAPRVKARLPVLQSLQVVIEAFGFVVA